MRGFGLFVYMRYILTINALFWNTHFQFNLDLKYVDKTLYFVKLLLIEN